MHEFWARVVVTGFCFGAWPLIMQRSGLGGNVQSVFFGGISFVLILLFSWRDLSFQAFAGADWRLAILAGALGAVGVLTFTGGLAKYTPATVTTFFVLVTLGQIVVPAVYQIYMSGGITMSKLIGFITAGIAVYFLLE